MIQPAASTPEVLLPAEAAAWLRLDDNGTRSDEKAIDSLNRLVERGWIRPLMIGHRRRYALEELRRFVLDRTQRYEPIKAKSD